MNARNSAAARRASPRGDTAAVAGPKPEYLTVAQRDALASELAELEGPRRAAIVEAIKTAREHGDLSENAEYHAAREEQGFLEARIRRLREQLDHSVLVDESQLAHGKIGVGSVVEIEAEDGERMEVEISSVGGTGAVSPESPLGRALVGAHEGDVVEVEAPRASWRARVLAVRRR